MADITIIDYGMGNIKSVQHAFISRGFTVQVTGDRRLVEEAKSLVLPGVGAFGKAVVNLEEKGLAAVIKQKIAVGTPFLGICLGLQLLYEGSEEAPGVKGLAVFKGGAVRFRGSVKVPLIGWNRITFVKKSPLLRGVANESFFYFVHSYYIKTEQPDEIIAVAAHGGAFPAIVGRDNVFGIQFHPEKSSRDGLKIINNFGKLVKSQWK